MNRTRWAAAVVAATALAALAGCGSSGSTAPPAPAATSAAGSGAAAIPGVSTPANPVPLLKAAGATPAAGTVTGQADVYGDRYAAGTIGDEDVRVYTSGSQAAYAENLHRFRPDDSQAVIAVPARNAVVILTAYIDPAKGDGPQWAAGGTPAQVAARVGGQVVPAS